MKKLIGPIICVIIFATISFAQQQPKGSFKKDYYKDCNNCSDPWVGEVFYKVWGICSALCDIKNWNNGSWSSKDHLTNIIRNKFCGKISSGRAYIFIKPQNVNFGLGTAGHIGWGFQLSNGSFYCGATENYAKGDLRTYLVLEGYDNDFWGEYAYHEWDMFSKMKSLGYSQYKVVGVNNPNILAAKKASEATMMKGFQGISNNCLDHTYTVLAAYGLNIFQLPSRQVFIFPNKWFNEFYPNVNGNGVYGKNL